MRLTKKCDNLYYTNAKFSSGAVFLDNNGSYTNACIDKLGQLEDIEEELGIDLITLFKAFTQGFIYMDIKENNKGVSEIIKFEIGGVLFDKEDKVWRLTNDDRYDGAYWGSLATNKNYGKTWALTKEELKK